MAIKPKSLQLVDPEFKKSLEQKGFAPGEIIVLYFTQKIFPKSYLESAINTGEVISVSPTMINIKFGIPVSLIYTGADKLCMRGYIAKRTGGVGNSVQYTLNNPLLLSLLSDIGN